MLTWTQCPSQGQHALWKSPRYPSSWLLPPLAQGHSLLLWELEQANPWLLLHCTMGKSAGALEKWGQVVPGHQRHLPRLTYFPH